MAIGERWSAAEQPDGDAHFALRLLLSTSPVPMWVYDLDTLGFLVVNEAAVERYGYSESDFSRLRITDIRPFEDTARLRSSDGRGGVLERDGLWRHLTAAGEVLWVDIASRVVDWPEHRAAIVIASELSEARTLSLPGTSSLPLLAHEPGFTRVVAERIEHARAIGAATGVIVVELEQLDHAGASVSPAVLDSAITRMVVVCAPTDTLGIFSTTRIGVVCLSPTADQVPDRAQRIEAALRDPLLALDDDAFEHGASVGVRVVEPGERGAEASAVVHEAQLALGEALRTRRSRPVVVFERRLHERLASQVARDQAIMRALRTEQFVLHYQPIVDLRTGRVTGYEALLRWPRPGGEIEGPTEVVALAEQTGCIVDLGSFLRRRALAEFGPLLEDDERLVLSLNLSPHELAHPALVTHIADLCTSSGVSPGQLCFELTESSLVSASNDFWGFSHLHELRGLGTKVAIDDFGTGYSALSYLKRLPVDIVKIDQSFVAELDSSRADTVLVETITRLAQALGLSVVAEGAETAGQLRVLEALGVDRVQGFATGRPVPIEALTTGARLAGDEGVVPVPGGSRSEAERARGGGDGDGRPHQGGGGEDGDPRPR